jgi:hypothetical protein
LSKQKGSNARDHKVANWPDRRAKLIDFLGSEKNKDPKDPQVFKGKKQGLLTVKCLATHGTETTLVIGEEFGPDSIEKKLKDFLGTLSEHQIKALGEGNVPIDLEEVRPWVSCSIHSRRIELKLNQNEPKKRNQELLGLGPCQECLSEAYGSNGTIEGTQELECLPKLWIPQIQGACLPWAVDPLDQIRLLEPTRRIGSIVNFIKKHLERDIKLPALCVQIIMDWYVKSLTLGQLQMYFLTHIVSITSYVDASSSHIEVDKCLTTPCLDMLQTLHEVGRVSNANVYCYAVYTLHKRDTRVCCDEQKEDC